MGVYVCEGRERIEVESEHLDERTLASKSLVRSHRLKSAFQRDMRTRYERAKCKHKGKNERQAQKAPPL